jgi:hypothetical protein
MLDIAWQLTAATCSKDVKPSDAVLGQDKQAHSAFTDKDRSMQVHALLPGSMGVYRSPVRTA